MIAEQRIARCMTELRRPCDCHQELRCPPHTTFHDMEEAVRALNEGLWYEPPAALKPDDHVDFTGIDWWLWIAAGTVTIGWVGLLVWAVGRIAHG